MADGEEVFAKYNGEKGVEAFDFAVDVMQVLLWQFENAPRLKAWLAAKQNWLNREVKQFWEDFYKNIFCLETANEFGLSIWSVILNTPLNKGIKGTGSEPVWGFDDNRVNFGTYRGDNEPALGVNFGINADELGKLSIEQRRLILRLRYFQLTTRGTVPEMNYFMKELFGEGCYVVDNYNMTFTYIFRKLPSQEALFVLTNFDILPRPAGVMRRIVLVNGQEEIHFGFDNFRNNFENGNFVQPPDDKEVKNGK